MGIGRAIWRQPWRLPPPRGRGYVFYRICWLAIALLSLLSIARSYPAELQDRRLTQAFYRLGLADRGKVLHGRLVAPADAQARASLMPREALIAIDGRPLPLDDSAIPQEIEGRDGTVAHLLLRRLDGTIHIVSRARGDSYLAEHFGAGSLSFPTWRWILFFSGQFADVFWLGGAMLLFWRRPHDAVSAVLAIGFALDTVDVGLFVTAFTLPANMAVGIVTLLTILLGLISFPDGRLATPSLKLMAVTGVLLAFAIETAALFPTSGAFRTALSISYMIPTFVAILLRYRSTPAGINRQQLKFAFLGFATGSLLQIVLLAISFFENLFATDYSSWAIVLIALLRCVARVALVGGLVVSLLRYRLYDAESAISRSVAYGALTLILLAVFAGSEKIIEEVGKEYLGHELGALAAGLGAAIAAILVTPLHHRITHWAERRFQGALVHLRHELPVLVGDMRETATPRALADAMLGHVENGVRASHGAVVAGGKLLDARDIGEDAVRAWLDNGQAPIERLGALHVDRDDPLFPMRVPLHAAHVGLVGWLLLGPRPDGSFYGRDERETLLDIAGPCARALVIAIERERRDRAREEDMHALHRIVAAVHERIEALAAIATAPASRSN